LHDGTLDDPAHADEGGAAAVVIAPGPPLTRADGRVQSRDCGSARCDPADYLDVAPPAAGGEDNAAFVDRSDVRAGNRDGFIAGPVAAAAGGVAVNDRVIAVTHAQLMPRILARVARELAHCVAVAPPAPEPACDPAKPAGRVPDAALGTPGCNAVATEPAWWIPWREHVLYVAAGAGGLDVLDPEGRRIAAGRRFAILATQRPGECAATLIQCEPAGCTQIATRPRIADRHEALVTMP